MMTGMPSPVFLKIISAHYLSRIFGNLRFNIRWFASWTILLILSGCLEPTSYTLRTPNLKEWAYRPTSNSEEKRDRQWWLGFNDPVLNDLMSKAQAQNPDLKVMKARLAMARADESATTADLMPNITAGINASRSKESGTITSHPILKPINNHFQANFDASWEVNIFGAGAAVRASKAYKQIAEATMDQALVSLYGEVARDYVQVRLQQQQLALQEQMVSAQKEIVTLTESLTKAGLVDGIALAQAQATLATNQSQLSVIRSDLSAATYQLETLLGEEPGALCELLNQDNNALMNHVQLAANDPILNSPAEILAQRPDIKQAERSVAYAASLKDVAMTQYYPKLNLSALLGLESSATGDWVQSQSKIWSLTGGLTAPIFDFGRIRAQVKKTDAQLDEALATYEKTVLGALSEIATALAALEQEEEHYVALDHANEANKLAFSLAKERYEKGLIAYQGVLENQKQLFGAQRELLQSEMNLWLLRIRIYKALGVVG